MLATAPAMRTVHVAAYTQRRQPGSERIDDDYVYEVAVTRGYYTSMQPSTVDPLSALRELGARLERKKDGEFKKIAAPAWAAALFNPA